MDIPRSSYPDQAQTSSNAEASVSQNVNLDNLTPEDRKVLRNLNHEAAIYRGYPCAIIFSGLTYFGTRTFPKMTTVGRLGISIVAGILGNFTGRLWYIPTAMKKLEVELPLDSPLRQLLKQRDEERKQHKSGRSTHPTLPPRIDPMYQQPSLPADVRDDTSDDTKPQVKNYYTYDQLRKAHREKERNIEKSSLSPAKQSLSEFGGDYSDTPETSKKVRYNKYGDPILEKN